MGRITVKGLYFDWLLSLITDGDKGFPYFKLCKELDAKRFRYFVPNDDNRCGDGLYLRQIFAEQERLDESHLEVSYFLKGEDCSVLEMLVALAQRIDFQTYDIDAPANKTAFWFLHMLQNLKLDIFRDEKSRGDRLSELDETKIDEILEIMMDRTYAFNGQGGLFPLKKARKDQTKVEIWYQLQSYIEEHRK